ncbi:ParB/RepB/Spo0J family partition protein [Jannaschia seohaensis]|uniref:Chromosome partitioning protein, ParB family n=1 Tax=Jannaschia seohaensis TaxID=475081 RepID=A0A2Y9A624_9RHOB|nr:ParB/RepB/Spo0J family partition protein [Jannaschia seohaensis]PWJ21761.1 ParB family chromosome partitioning protein [Jannaschia seohaensis]SSA38039.1 chromosome partitioning protein, ParB family [Jannaschia seohaensis]
MSETGQRRPMRRGLSALMADIGVDADDASSKRPVTGDRQVPIEQIRPNPNQPRRQFDEERLSDLAASISAKGVLSPLIVRPISGEDVLYEIVAGERRWRAAQRSGLHEVPVLVREFDDTEVLEVAIIENIQRDDLNAIEEASGYRDLIERFGHTQEQLSTQLGKSRSHVANLMRLLKLPDSVQNRLRSGEISAGHARALVTAPDPEALSQKVVREGLSVRETEKLAKGARPSKQSRPKAAEKDADTRALEGDLTAALGLLVQIAHVPGDEGGHVSIRYRSLDELDRLCNLLSNGLGDT